MHNTWSCILAFSYWSACRPSLVRQLWNTKLIWGLLWFGTNEPIFIRQEVSGFYMYVWLFMGNCSSDREVNYLTTLAKLFCWSSRLSTRMALTKRFSGLNSKRRCFSYDTLQCLSLYLLSSENVFPLFLPVCFADWFDHYTSRCSTDCKRICWSQCLRCTCLSVGKSRNAGLWKWFKLLLIALQYKSTSENSFTPSFRLQNKWIEFEEVALPVVTGHD